MSFFSPEAPSKSILVAGKSGQGKSTFLARFCKERGKKCFLVQGDEEDYQEIEDLTIAELDKDLTEQRDCCIVVDDLFSLTKRESGIFRKLINFTRRHNDADVCTAVHTFTHVDLSSIFHNFTTVVMTCTSSTDPNAKFFLKRSGSESVTEATFDGMTEGYLCWDAKSDTFECFKDDFSPLVTHDEKRAEKLRQDIMKGLNDIFVVFPEHKAKATCLASFIVSNYDCTKIDSKDFTITLAKGNSEKMVVSLVDYVMACQDGSMPITRDLKALKQYFRSLFRVPSSLVTNPKMK